MVTRVVHDLEPPASAGNVSINLTQASKIMVVLPTVLLVFPIRRHKGGNETN